MVSIQEISNLAWLQIFPPGSDEATITLQEFIQTAKAEFAYAQLLMAWKDKREDGYFQVPSYLSTETEPLPVVDNSIDISDLDILRSLPQESWMQRVGNLDCQCSYVKSTINQSQLLCDDDSLGDQKTYFIIGNKIRFPRGTHADSLPIIYANNGANLDNLMMIDDAMASIVRDKLVQIYGGKVPPADQTNNSNSSV